MPRPRPTRSAEAKAIEALLESPDFVSALKRARTAVRAENQRAHNERKQAHKREVRERAQQAEQARIDAVMEQALLRVLHVRTGTWRAEDVEPYLKPLTSSLDPRTFPNYFDADEEA